MKNPYIGPKPFETGQELFGRDRETAELRYLLTSERIVLLYSPSGAGKSSLVNAGLIPAIQSRFDILGPTRVNAQTAEGVKNRYVASAIGGLSKEETHEDITLAEYIARHRGKRNPLILFDQFEEILRVDPSDVEAKREFFRQAGELLSDRSIWALFVIREDYLAPLDPYVKALPSHLQNRYRIDRLTKALAEEAMVNPLVGTGRSFAPGVVTTLAANLATAKSDYVEPLQLQVVCYDLWERMEEAGKKEIEERDLGDVSGALRNYYDRAVKSAAGNERTEREIRLWFDKQLITPDGVRNVVRGGLPDDIIKSLQDSWLVRREPRGGVQWYELAHDRLVDPVRASNFEWWSRQDPILRAARDWKESGGDRRYLYDGDQLKQIRESLTTGEADPMLTRFLDVCEAAEEERNEKAKAEERERRRQTTLVVTQGGASAGFAFFVYLRITGEVTLSGKNIHKFLASSAELRGNHALLRDLAVFALFYLGGCLIGYLFLLLGRMREEVTRWLASLTRKHRMDRSLQGTAAKLPPPLPIPARLHQEAGFEPDEVRTLQFAPFWVFLAAAGSVGTITRGRVRKLMRTLRRLPGRPQGATAPPARIAALFPASARGRRQLMKDFIDDPRYATDGLQDAAALIAARTSAGEQQTLKAALLQFAEQVAWKANRDSTLRFVAGALEGKAPDVGAVRARYYRQSEVTSPRMLLLALAAGVTGGAVLGALMALTPLGPATGVPLFVPLLRILGLPALAGALTGGAAYLGMRATKVRSPFAVNLVALCAAAAASLALWQTIAPENQEVAWIEIPVMAGVAIWIGRGVLDKTYCELCGNWCKLEQGIAWLRPGKIEQLRPELEAGRLSALESLVISAEYVRTHRENWRVDMHTCSRCGDFQALSVTSIAANKAESERKKHTEAAGCLMTIGGLFLPILSLFRNKDADTKEKKLIDRLLVPAGVLPRLRELAQTAGEAK